MKQHKYHFKSIWLRRSILLAVGLALLVSIGRYLGKLVEPPTSEEVHLYLIDKAETDAINLARYQAFNTWLQIRKNSGLRDAPALTDSSLTAEFDRTYLPPCLFARSQQMESGTDYIKEKSWAFAYRPRVGTTGSATPKPAMVVLISGDWFGLDKSIWVYDSDDFRAGIKSRGPANVDSMQPVDECASPNAEVR